MDSYQGYANRETFALVQRLTRDPTASAYIKERIAEIRLRASNAKTRTLTEVFLAEMLEEAYAEDLTNISRDMFDLIREVGSLWRVDWREVAEEFLNE